MGVSLNQCTECSICHKEVPRWLYGDHYAGHFRRPKRVATPRVAAGENIAREANPLVSADERTVMPE